MNTLLKYFFMVLLALPFISEGQQIRVLSERVDFAGEIGSFQRKTVILQNETNTPKNYFLKNLRGSVGSSQKVKVCIGDQCFDPRKDLAKIKITLDPGEIVTDFYLEFEMGISETKGSFDLFFVNAENIRESFVVEASYNVSNVSNEDFLHKDIKISEVYPNPSNRIAQLDYKLINPKANAKITINSFIGNPIAEYVLDPEKTNLVINVSDYTPGIYLYTLFVDNKNIVTKKLRVNK
jgi:hypothetical protein